MLLTDSLQKLREGQFPNIELNYLRFNSALHLRDHILTMLILVHIFENEVVWIGIELWIHFQTSKVYDIPSFICSMVIPLIGCGIDNEQWFSVMSVGSVIQLQILERLHRFISESLHEVCELHGMNVGLVVSHGLLNYEFDMDTELSQEMPGIISEYKPLFDVSTENETVRQIEIRR